MPAWVDSALAEYSVRLPRELHFERVSLALGVRSKSGDPARAQRDEAERTLKRVAADERVIALDERGEAWTSRDLATRLQRWQLDGRDVVLLVGGPDGHHPLILERAEERWSLSRLTLPHALVPILIVEQLYRASSLNAGHPYHRGEPG